jgi:hypothetical protein
VPAHASAGADAFLRAAIAAMRLHGRSRVLVLLEPPDAAAQVAVTAAAADVAQRCVENAQGSAPEVAVAGLLAAGAAGALLERVVAACDPARPALVGWQREA